MTAAGGRGSKVRMTAWTCGAYSALAVSTITGPASLRKRVMIPLKPATMTETRGVTCSSCGAGGASAAKTVTASNRNANVRDLIFMPANIAAVCAGAQAKARACSGLPGQGARPRGNASMIAVSLLGGAVMRRSSGFVSCLLLLAAGALAAPPESNEALAAQVRETERAFAKTMADRDHAAFTSFISEDAVFLSRSAALRGRQAVADGWKPLFDGPRAPFSWEPERVEVLASGTLAISTGPVFSPEGKRTGT